MSRPISRSPRKPPRFIEIWALASSFFTIATISVTASDTALAPTATVDSFPSRARVFAASHTSMDFLNPPPHRMVPADGRITIRDYGYRDWGPEPVRYVLPSALAKSPRVALTDESGARVPCQVEDGVLCFVASVPKGSTATYHVAPETRKTGGPSSLTVRREGKALIVENEHLSLRMPAPQTIRHREPADASRILPPILQWAGRDRKWMGRARYVTDRKAMSQVFRIIRKGPAVVEYEARTVFTPKGEYAWRVRLSPDAPVAVVSEEFDFGSITEGKDLLVLDLHRGWSPGNIGWVDGAGEQQTPPLVASGYGAYLAAKRVAKPIEAPVGGVGSAPEPFPPGEGAILLEKILPAGRWGATKGGAQVWDGETAAPGAKRTIGMVPLFVGSWRRAMAICAWHEEGTGLRLTLPISVRWSRWSIDVTDDHSPFSTHEHDPTLPPSLGRRCWGLTAGTPLNEAQAQFGYIGLDRYKEWIVEVPENPSVARYPGAFFSPEQIERLRPVLDRHPDAAFLKSWFLFSGRAEDAAAHARSVIDRLRKPYEENDFRLTGLSNYRKSQFLAFVCQAEDALACPGLPEDLRRELRLRLALYACVLSDPDFNPRGAGVHLGNNNMPINRTLALSYFAGLLPDHPRYRYWMERIREFVAYKLATEMAVDGPNIEAPSYALYSPYRTMNLSINILRNRGIHDFAPEGAPAGFLRWLGHLSMADPRTPGRRIIPGMGNSSNLVENVWGFSMAAHEKSDPDFAGWLRFMNRVCSGDASHEPGPNYHDNVNSTPHAFYYLPYLPEKPAHSGTVFLPTYGVVFRDRFNTPNETALLLRAGMNWAHWDTDALNVILYGKGAPLSPGTGYQYYSGPAAENNAIYHNRVKMGQPDAQECFGRVDNTVRDYGFGESVDVAVASRFTPSQVFHDGGGPMTWNRHVMFLKTARDDGTSYFVVRDTFEGGKARRRWWHWLNLGTADRIRVDGVRFDAGKTPVDAIVPEDRQPLLRGREMEMEADPDASTRFWFSRPIEARARMTFQAAGETKTIVQVPGGPGDDFHFVLTPKKAGDPVPACESPADGVIRIKTPESTDTTFLGDAPFDWNRDGVVFTGKSGAVRVYDDRVVLSMGIGSGRIGWRGHILEGHGPFERTIRNTELDPGTRRIEGGYEKKRQVVQLGRGVTVRGEGPFTAWLDGDAIRIRTSGRARVIHVTHPPFIVRPRYTIDGRQWMACWTDYPNNGWGTYDDTWLIGLSVPEGDHDLTITEQEWSLPPSG